MACIHEGKAQLDGCFYEHEGESNNVIVDDDDMDKKMPAQQTSKKMRTMTSALKGFQKFEINTATGYPICPITRKVIDGTVPYYKSCFSFGHSHISFTGCGKHDEWLALNAKKEETDNKNETSNEEVHEIND